MTDEKILQKVGKLLLKFGVAEDEKNEFVSQLRDMKDDSDEKPAEEEQPAEQPAEQPVPEEKPAEETPSEEQPKEEEEQSAENPEEKVEEPSEEEVAKESEKPAEEQQPAVPTDDETKKLIEGLTARINTLEEIISKLGIEVKEQDIGLPSSSNGEESEGPSFQDKINKARMGY